MQLQSAIEGTLNVIRQSLQAGVTKVVLTSSWATTLDRMLPLDCISAGEMTHFVPCLASLVATFSGATFTEKGINPVVSSTRHSESIPISIDWGHTSREDVLATDRNPLYVYCGTKTLAEQAAWKFAEEHKDLDLATSEPLRASRLRRDPHIS